MRLLGALAFAVLCLLALVGHPGTLRAADPVAPAPDLVAQDGPFTRNEQVDLAFTVPPEGGPVSEYRASNDAATSDGVLTNGAAVAANALWTLSAGPDGPRTVYGQVKYESGLWSPVASVSLTLDTTPSSSVYVDLDSVGSRIPAPPDFDWHARSATPADRVFGLGVYDGTGPAEVGVGDEQRFIYFVTATGPMGVGSYDVQRAGDSGCESACATVGARGNFCEASGGSFTITDIAFTPEGDLDVLDADFRLECIDTLMSGSIRYGASRDIVALDQDAESVQFPDETVGSASPAQSISFTNIGTASTTLGAAALTSGEPGDFAITSDDCSGATLAVGASCDVAVTFSPSALGQRQTFLDIPDDTSRGSRHVLVQGQGVSPTPPKAGKIVVMAGARCTDSRFVTVRATGATGSVGIDRLELSNHPSSSFAARPIAAPQHWTLTTGDGRKTVYARWWNTAGLVSAVVKDAILLDTTAATSTRPNPSIRAGDRVIDGRVRVGLTWTGSDATCGVSRYVLAVSRNGHPWQRIGDPTTAPHAVRHLRMGPTYRFRVRAIDNAGNAGDWAASVRFHIVGTKAHPRIEVVQIR